MGSEWLIKKARFSDEGLVWAMAETLNDVRSLYFNPILNRLRYLGFNVDNDKSKKKDIIIIRGNAPTITIENEFGNWSTIEFRSYNKSEGSQVGRSLDALLMDEFRYMHNQELLEEQLLLNLMDRRGELLIISTPHGRDLLYKLYEKGRKDNFNINYDYNWKSWKYDSYDNPYAKHEIEVFKKIMSKAKFEQEVMCNFNVSQDTVYNEFNYHINAKKHIPVNHDLPLCLSFDFNYGLMTTTVSQIRDGLKEPYENEHGFIIEEQDKVIDVIKSINTQNTNTQRHCEEIKRWLKEIKWDGQIVIYGDASGNQRNTASSATNWQIIESNFISYNVLYALKDSNPLVEDRVNSVNMKLRNAENKIGVFVDAENAEPLIKDFEQVTRDKAGRIEKERLEKLGYNHNVDNFGYMVEYEFEIGSDVEMDTIWLKPNMFVI